VYVRSGSTWSQQAKLIGSDTDAGSREGTSVALSSDGNTLVAGGNFDNSQVGAVWVYVRTGTTWTQQGSKLVGNAGPGGEAGADVSLSSDGNTLAVGCPIASSQLGAMLVWVRTGTSWTQQAKLVDSTFSGKTRQGYRHALSSDGNTLVVGAFVQQATIVWARSGATWAQVGKFNANDAIGFSQFGAKIAVSGTANTIAVGGQGDNNVMGATWIFELGPALSSTQ
jgi:hypothetical protein